MNDQLPGHAEASGPGSLPPEVVPQVPQPPVAPPVPQGSPIMPTIPSIHPKVAAGALAGAVVIVAMWALSYFGHIVQPPEVVAAETVIVQTAIAWAVPSSTT